MVTAYLLLSAAWISRMVLTLKVAMRFQGSVFYCRFANHGR